MYGGGQFELGPGRRQIQRLASLFYADGPNDVAPSEYNEGGARPGLPTSPLPAAGGRRPVNLLRRRSRSAVRRRARRDDVGRHAVRARARRGERGTTGSSARRSGCSSWPARRRCARPTGSGCCEPWDVAAFPRGEAGAHQVRNDSGEPVRVVFFSTVSDPEVRRLPRRAARSASPPAGGARTGRTCAATWASVTEVVNLLRRRGRRGDRPRRLSHADSSRSGGQLGGELLGCSALRRSARASSSGRTTTTAATRSGSSSSRAGRRCATPDGRARAARRATSSRFPEGEAGAHTLVNRTARSAPRRDLLDAPQRARRSTRTAARSARTGRVYRTADAVDYWDGEAP